VLFRSIQKLKEEFNVKLQHEIQSRHSEERAVESCLNHYIKYANIASTLNPPKSDLDLL
jgi:hypothetical protein